MKKEDILKYVDHTLLTQTATWEDIQRTCDEAAAYQTASVMIPPCYVKQAVSYLQGRQKVATVIGFPNGNTTTAVKLFEAREALENGAEEIDMVANLGWLRDGKYDDVENEIRDIKEACGSHILKVIIETCLLTQEEKIRMCEIVSRAGADFIKTSTGFSRGGATFEDIKLMTEHVSSSTGVKAAGGISSLQDAEHFIRLGAGRLGTSRIVKLIKEEENR